MSASAVLCDVQMDDSRPNRQNCITRYMKKKDTSNVVPVPVPQKLITIKSDKPDETDIAEPVSSMVDIVARMTDSEMFLQLKVSSFDLILSLDFIMQLMKFLHVSDEQKSENKRRAHIHTNNTGATAAAAAVVTATASQPEKCESSW